MSDDFKEKEVKFEQKEDKKIDYSLADPSDKTLVAVETEQIKQQPENNTLLKKSKFGDTTFGLIIILMAIASTVACLLSLVNMNTKPIIDNLQREAAAEAMKKVIVADTYDQIPDTQLYMAKTGGQLVGFAVQSYPKGYGGTISLMVGVDLNGKVTGIDIVKHAETPGLGSKAKELPWFTDQFKGKDASVKLGENVDAITGSTITSAAVTDGVQSAVVEVMEYLTGG